jgi:hypothetical protein
LVTAYDALNRADAGTFPEQLQHQQGLLDRQIHRAERPGAALREGPAADTAAVALPAVAGAAKLLGVLGLA